MDRQTEFADEGPPRRLILTQAPPKVLDIDGTHLFARRNGELVTVDHNPNRYCVHFGNRPGDCLCARRFRASEQGGQHRANHESAAAAKDVSPMKTMLMRIS